MDLAFDLEYKYDCKLGPVTYTHAESTTEVAQGNPGAGISGVIHVESEGMREDREGRIKASGVVSSRNGCPGRAARIKGSVGRGKAIPSLSGRLSEHWERDIESSGGRPQRAIGG